VIAVVNRCEHCSLLSSISRCSVPRRTFPRRRRRRRRGKVRRGIVTNPKIGSGRLRSARTPANIQTVNDLICSQEDRPGSHKNPREISRETGISRSAVYRTAEKDLYLKTFRRREVQLLSDSNIRKRLVACKQLKKRLTRHKLD